MELLELLKTILESMISETKLMRVEMKEIDDCLVFEVDVPPDETGKVIGKQGNTANAIRTILRCAAAKSDIRREIILEILEDPNYRRRRRYSGETRQDGYDHRPRRYRNDY